MSGIDDQLWKETVPVFAADFVTLVAPEIAAQIDLGALTFRLEELFADSPSGGKPRRPDLVARVPTRAGPEKEVILHAEVEARYRSKSIPRFFDYNRLLDTRYGLPVHTLVLYLRGGPAGLEAGVYRVHSLGRTINLQTVQLRSDLHRIRAWDDRGIRRPLPARRQPGGQESDDDLGGQDRDQGLAGGPQ